jgi:diguanylate cyclase (GGDEF)-like protein
VIRVLSAAFLIQLGLHGLTGALSFLLGARAFGDQGGGAALLLALALVSALVMAALGTVIEAGWRRGPRAAGPDRSQTASPAQFAPLPAHDALTGLPNRMAFLDRLQAVLDGARHGDRMAAVLCVDLADFATINQTLGHVAGDLLLRHAGARMLAVLRECDLLARSGADAFAILQYGVASPGGAVDLCERLLAAMDEPFELCGRLTPVGLRIGVALLPADGSAAEALLGRAGVALGRARAGPPRGFRFFDDAIDRAVRERKALERDLARALARGELEIEYQPQFDIQSRRMFGVEALLRWQHPERGRIAPDGFIPLAEDSGLIVPIGRWVLEQACRQAMAWQRQGAPELRIAVNLSPVQCRDPALAGQVADILEASGLPARQLELEITERVLLAATEANLETLGKLKRLGVRISLDDFGTGHSSLGYLRRFPFDEIKLDRSFVGALQHDPSAHAILRAFLSLGRSLGLDSIAEGVESAEQLAVLDAEGCRLAQGFYFSPPVHPREIDAMIAALATASESHFPSQELRITG